MESQRGNWTMVDFCSQRARLVKNKKNSWRKTNIGLQVIAFHMWPREFVKRKTFSFIMVNVPVLLETLSTLSGYIITDCFIHSVFSPPVRAYYKKVYSIKICLLLCCVLFFHISYIICCCWVVDVSCRLPIRNCYFNINKYEDLKFIVCCDIFYLFLWLSPFKTMA